MTYQEACEKLSNEIDKKTGDLYNSNWYLSYNKGDRDAILDGEFNADDLEAIAVFIRHSQGLV